MFHNYSCVWRGSSAVTSVGREGQRVTKEHAHPVSERKTPFHSGTFGKGPYLDVPLAVSSDKQKKHKTRQDETV